LVVATWVDDAAPKPGRHQPLHDVSTLERGFRVTFDDDSWLMALATAGCVLLASCSASESESTTESPSSGATAEQSIDDASSAQPAPADTSDLTAELSIGTRVALDVAVDG
jgi:hypothetical protein